MYHIRFIHRHWYLVEGWSQLKFVDTALRKIREDKKAFDLGFFTTISEMKKDSLNYANGANTSVLPLKHSEFFLALYEGGLPFMMKKANL